MTDSHKLIMLKSLTAGLKTITPANGYQSDLGDFDPGDGGTMSRVFRGRVAFGDSDPVPMVSVLEAVTETEALGVQPVGEATQVYEWPLLLQGWVRDDQENPTDPAYVLLADVRQYLARLAKRVKKMDNDILGVGPELLHDLQFSGGLVRPADETNAYAGFWLTLRLTIVDRAENPYE